MSYETALRIVDVVDNIYRKKYLLPAIQREFVWNPEQVERLFDSLMQDYPISSFLFWNVSKEHVHDYEFYEFIKDYHERYSRHNPKATLSGEEGLTAILDGQQRLTSIYIGLKGSYSNKIPRKRWDNDLAYPKKLLYLNLISESDETDLKYDFQFLISEEAGIRNNDVNWFKVSQILDLKEPGDVNSYLIETGIFSDYSKEKASFANNTLFKLHNVIHEKGTISYYQEKSQVLDKVLNIFIRINSGGTILSYSDLLLSIATAQWTNRDAREEIFSFVDSINSIGDGFNFTKDFVLKSCLVLSGIKDIAFKVDNFNKPNMQKIEDEWDKISSAIRIAIGLISGFGYSRETLTSNNAIIPIAYFIKKNDLSESIITSTKAVNVKASIAKWLRLSLIKRVFSGQPDNVLRPLRRIIDENGSDFPLDQFKEHFKGTNKSLLFSNEEIDNLLGYSYDQSFTFSVLALLYPDLDYRNVFHIDHMFPQSLFTYSKLTKRNLSSVHILDFITKYNRLANLQLLEERPNLEKRNKEFDVWFSESFSTESERYAYKERHMIPDVNLQFENFLAFFNERESILKNRLCSLLK
ncbi:MAG TPA: DUF262 domain-containing protein [Desulfobacteraceae bacterium]|jgi:uncharacterized protein with ParB-like and HNH nuclease domain|uniref:DUF262 domain-containing protein n=1 Tax=SAR324 cluster bacterium TaxID=2024889 RepID=A0A7X9IK77_9DELT|nr:DUF262 domain-containing protein [SAR324 cluster bacterium]HPQ29398.1 DUF262 domain-containing protein [Desulfobacteraceae bacterium]